MYFVRQGQPRSPAAPVSKIARNPDGVGAHGERGFENEGQIGASDRGCVIAILIRTGISVRVERMLKPECRQRLDER
jgi:hypothetical protein